MHSTRFAILRNVAPEVFPLEFHGDIRCAFACSRAQHCSKEGDNGCLYGNLRGGTMPAIYP